MGLFVVAWALFTPSPAAAAGSSYIWVGAPGEDSITSGQFVRYPHVGERIHAVHGVIGGAQNALAIDVLDAAGRVVGTVRFSPPKGKALVPGTYRKFTVTQGDYSGAQFSISSVGGRCNVGDGDVVIDRASFTPAGDVRQFHATFRNMCGSGMRPAYGEIGIGVPLPRSVPVAPPPGKATMEVIGAEDAPIVRNNRHRFVNLVNATFDVSVGTAARVRANVSGQTDGYELRLTPPAGRPFARGRYDGAVSLFDAKRTGAPGLEFSGNHSVCQEVRGWYVIEELVLAPNGFLQRFRATFVQYCGTHTAPVRGTVTAEMPAWVSGYATPETAALVLASVRLRPAVPSAGRTYSVSVAATEFVTISCSATLAGRRLAGRIRRVGARRTWTWQIPAAAGRAVLRVRLTATASGQIRVRTIARTVR